MTKGGERRKVGAVMSTVCHKTREARPNFFEKKKQKTFGPAGFVRPRLSSPPAGAMKDETVPAPAGRKFFARFFSKKRYLLTSCL
jgi:hypothetical protein